jgi:uncharacterized membrane protein YqiK
VSKDYSDNQPRQTQYAPAREEKSSGAGTAIMLVFIGLLFIVGPFITGAYVKIPTMSQVIISAFGVLMLVGGGIMFTITQLYEKATMNEAFVRTGVGGPKVVVNGAAIVIPAIHRVTRVSLETIRLEIARLAGESFITGDNLHVDVKAQFYIKVNNTEEAIMAAATSLGGKSGVDQMIMDLVGDKLISALRTIAGRRELDFLHAHVDDYSKEVKEIAEADLEHNGLFLESVTVTYLNQTPLSNLKPLENIFDAQGAKKIAEVVNRQQVEVSIIEAKAKKETTEQEVSRDRYVAEQGVIRATANADADYKTKTVQSEAARKAAEFAAEQDRLTKLAQVTSTQAVDIAGVERTKAVALANAQQEREVKIAQAGKDQAVQTAEVAKTQAVETAGVLKEQTVAVAKREQEIAVADAERRRAEAETARIAAETERTKAEQAKLTVEKESEAERLKRVAVIAKQSLAQQTQIERNMEADVAAYTTVKQAEAGKDAAEANAEARRTLAQGTKDALTLEAEGNKALAMVPVEVARNQVSVDQAKVDVLKNELAAKTANEKMAFELEVRRLEIAANRDARIAIAQAMGQALAAANMTIYGDPGTFQRMMGAFVNGQQQGRYVEGLLETVPDKAQEIAFDTIDRISGAVSNLAKTMFGKEVPADLIATAVQAELAKQTGTPTSK